MGWSSPIHSHGCYWKWRVTICLYWYKIYTMSHSKRLIHLFSNNNYDSLGVASIIKGVLPLPEPPLENCLFLLILKLLFCTHVAIGKVRRPNFWFKGTPFWNLLTPLPMKMEVKKRLESNKRGWKRWMMFILNVYNYIF